MKITETEWIEGLDEPTLIVADAGGTKTEWIVLSRALCQPIKIISSGINISVGSDSDISDSFKNFLSQLQEKGIAFNGKNIIFYFYGAGCNSQTTKNRIEKMARKCLPCKSLDVKSFSDLEGAGLALYGDASGIVCILGTGSSSGWYENRIITSSVPSLGYILGDEGSGAYMGKELINRYFKKELSAKCCAALKEYTNMFMPEILEKIYRMPNAQAFLASFVPFIKEMEYEEEISELIDRSLKLFFEKNVLKYSYTSGDSVGFVGGVAVAFASRLSAIATEHNLFGNKFIQRPTEYLAIYYKEIYNL